MRRAFAISLAALAMMFMARGVMAQDAQQDGNDLLLKILKERNVLSESEYEEIKGQLAAEKGAVDQKLTAIDRSLADYLAKAGDVSGGNTSYVQNQGTTFTSGDGMFSVFFGGLFQFGYAYSEGDNLDPDGGFELSENRFDFGGWFFDPNLQFYTQIASTQNTFLNEFADFFDFLDFFGDDGEYPFPETAQSFPYSFGSGLYLLDAYLDYLITEGVQVRVGVFKVPYGRQSQIDQSDRAFGHLSGPAQVLRINFTGRDAGAMFHGTYMFDGSDDGMALEWAAGIWNGSGGNRTVGDNDTWLMYGARVAFYPMGAIPYVEGDWNPDGNVRVGIGASVFVDESSSDGSGDNPTNTWWQADVVLTWNGLYFQAEYFSVNVDDESISSDEMEATGWYAQAGFFVMPAQLEVLARIGMVTSEDVSGEPEVTEWALGGVWYFDGHELKLIGEIGQWSFESDFDDDSDDWFIRMILQLDW